MVSDNDDITSTSTTNSNSNQEFKSTNSQQQHPRSGKTTRSGLFTGGIFTRVRKFYLCQFDRKII